MLYKVPITYEKSIELGLLSIWCLRGYRVGVELASTLSTLGGDELRPYA